MPPLPDFPSRKNNKFHQRLTISETGRPRPLPIVTYLPDNTIRKGYLGMFVEIWREFIDNRWLTWQLFKRDFFAAYKQSLFGVFWAFIMPLMSMATFVLLNRAGLFSIGEIDIPYPIFAVLGLSFWQLFSSGLVSSSNSLVKAGNMLTQINFSRKSLVYAAAGQSIISFIIQFMLLVVLLLVYKIRPDNSIYLTPLLVMPVLLMTLGLGLILSILNGVIRDISNVLALLMSLLLFLTPVLYAEPKEGVLSVLTYYNPMFYLISSSRELILFGSMKNPLGYAVSVAISFLTFVVCLIVFHISEAKITERI